eukprot:4136512-Amphidinium_carterae.1
MRMLSRTVHAPSDKVTSARSTQPVTNVTLCPMVTSPQDSLCRTFSQPVTCRERPGMTREVKTTI